MLPLLLTHVDTQLQTLGDFNIARFSQLAPTEADAVRGKGDQDITNMQQLQGKALFTLHAWCKSTRSKS